MNESTNCGWWYFQTASVPSHGVPMVCTSCRGATPWAPRVSGSMNSENIRQQQFDFAEQPETDRGVATECHPYIVCFTIYDSPFTIYRHESHSSFRCRRP